MHELRRRDVQVESQANLPFHYDGLLLNAALRMNILVGDLLIVEFKAVEQILPIHTAQLLTYLKLSKRRLGLLINFNVSRIKDGIRRVAL